MERPRLLGAIEAGGTKFILAIGTGHDDIHARTVIATKTPADTLQDVIHWFAAQSKIDGLGIATFGPAELDVASPKWGYITRTTKAGWSDTNFARHLGSQIKVPVGFDTDVNGAALGEYRHGAAQGCPNAVYVTIGTGIGGGAIIDGKPVHGLGHPEMGHFRPRKASADKGFEGVCPFHGDCLEGLASGPAILARWGKTLSQLPSDHHGHDMIAGYIAELCNTLRALYAPQVIILGGGVMATEGLLERIIDKADRLGGGYFSASGDSIIRAPGLGAHSGIAGAFALAEDALSSALNRTS